MRRRATSAVRAELGQTILTMLNRKPTTGRPLESIGVLRIPTLAATKGTKSVTVSPQSQLPANQSDVP